MNLLPAQTVDELGIDGNAAPAEVRAALLRRLPEEDFVLPSRLHEAFVILRRVASDTVLPAESADIDCAEEQRLREELDEFTAEFFTLDRVERNRRWLSLDEHCCKHPALHARLMQLDPGVGYVRPDAVNQDAYLVQLVEHCEELFVLPPVKRAQRRKEIIQRLTTDSNHWIGLARQIVRQFPQVSDLEPTLLTQVLTTRQRKEQARHSITTRAKPATKEESSTGSGSRISAGILIALAVLMIRICAGTSSYQKSSSPTLPPMPTFRFDPPPTFRFDPLPTYRRFEDEDIMKLLEQIERDHRLREGPPAGIDSRPGQDQRRPSIDELMKKLRSDQDKRPSGRPTPTPVPAAGPSPKPQGTK